MREQRLPHRWLLVFTAALLASALPSFSEVPELAWGKAEAGRQAPMWVALDQAVVDGELAAGLFLPAIRQTIEHHMWVVRDQRGSAREHDAPESECTTHMEPSAPSLGRYKGTSLQSIAEASAQVLTGAVVAQRQGFLYGRPGTLYEVALDATANLPAELGAGGDRLFVFLRIADFMVGDVRICSGVTEDRATPVVGGSAVLALETSLDERTLGSSDDGAPIVEPRGYEVFLQAKGGRPSAPGRYKGADIDVERLRAELPLRWSQVKGSGVPQ